MTKHTLEKIQQAFPELLDLSLQVPLLTPDGAEVESNPEAMARKFGVPYLGALPMDPNLTKACEKGLNFLEEFPDSARSVYAVWLTTCSPNSTSHKSGNFKFNSLIKCSQYC